jgi:hypothetical protein
VDKAQMMDAIAEMRSYHGIDIEDALKNEMHKIIRNSTIDGAMTEVELERIHGILGSYPEEGDGSVQVRDGRG